MTIETDKTVEELEAERRAAVKEATRQQDLADVIV